MKLMKPFECGKEKLIIAAVRTGLWDADLRQHRASCPACSEAAIAARLLNEMRSCDEAEARIPDAGLMWWKAQLLEKREAAERATQPINFAERFAYAWAAICFVGICVWRWAAIRAWLSSVWNGRTSFTSAGDFISHFGQSLTANLLGKSAYFREPGWLVAPSLVILLVLVVFAAYFAHSEE
jgi:hypothetical protein